MSQRFKLSYTSHVLHFKKPSGTSRGVMTEKKCWILELRDQELEISGIGECSIIEGLSPDYISDEQYESKLDEVVQRIDSILANPKQLAAHPSILMGVESCIFDLVNGGKRLYFPSTFTQHRQFIPINGLVWMGDEAFMKEQIQAKIDDGYSCIKMKVAAIDFETEYNLLESIRKQFSKDQMTIRVDANGGFTPEEVTEKLKRLAQLDIHSIEQPIATHQWTALSTLCNEKILPIALDEELIGIHLLSEKRHLLETVKPQYIILKPSLHGGFSGSREWIDLANSMNIDWWITSALESNIGLNAIAQFTGTFEPTIPQGLGTGGLFTQNFEAPIYIEEGKLIYHG